MFSTRPKRSTCQIDSGAASHRLRSLAPLRPQPCAFNEGPQVQLDAGAFRSGFDPMVRPGPRPASKCLRELRAAVVPPIPAMTLSGNVIGPGHRIVPAKESQYVGRFAKMQIPANFLIFKTMPKAVPISRMASSNVTVSRDQNPTTLPPGRRYFPTLLSSVG